MRLAAKLGRANVDAMLREMSAEQWAEWCAFYALEPWGFREENRRMSILASTIANTAGKVLRNPVSAEDFMPQDEPERPSGGIVGKIRALLGGR